MGAGNVLVSDVAFLILWFAGRREQIVKMSKVVDDTSHADARPE
jgi:hypothetical protein